MNHWFPIMMIGFFLMIAYRKSLLEPNRVTQPAVLTVATTQTSQPSTVPGGLGDPI